MIKKGIILAGGTGSRLSPLTKIINKQLLPLYDKPLVFYPLSILMLAGIRDILIITNPNEDINFRKILGNGSNFGIKIQYLTQNKPNGLPEAFIIGEKFINNKNVALILGDNFFYGQGFTKRLKQKTKAKSGSTIFTYQVNNPEDYGIVEIKNKKIFSIKEKPKNSKSNLAITGLYFFDHNVVNISKKLRPSKRGELEIVDLLKEYLSRKKLKIEYMGRGSAWLDTGNAESLFETSQFISNIEKRQGLKIACLEEIALNNKWISKNIIKKQINFYGNCEYSRYLRKLIYLE
jgi:glucose-1-phosphate thymidylyltransferase